MPRGSRPGERRGGRQRGTPNKKTLLKHAAISATATDPNITPLAFLLRLMRDESLPIATRIEIAATAVPLSHAKPKPAKGAESTGHGSTPGEEGAGESDSLVQRVKVELVPKSAVQDNLGPDTISPLKFLQQVMTDPATPPQQRIRAARIAAPFRHGKPIEPTLNTDDMISKDEYGFEVDQRLARKLRDLVVADWRTRYLQKKDENLDRQLADLRKTLPRPPLSYGDGQARIDKSRMIEYWADRIGQKSQLKLSAQQDAAISHACFRFLSFAETWGIGFYDHYTMCQAISRKMKRAEMK